MTLCIILFKTLILFALFFIFNCVDLIRTFEPEQSITYDDKVISINYDEERQTETVEYPTQSFNDIVEKTTDAEEIVTDENNIQVVCPYFKKSGEINLERMVGVWRPEYYQVSQKVPCFKMLIREVNAKEKTRYSQLYGDFNEKVIWDDCNLEIKSSANLVYRKHFLQGCKKGFGVLENIIIEKKGDAVPILVEETADQWLAINRLLLLRDCFSGDIVIFSEEDYKPKLYDILESMKIFGNITRGEWACNDGAKTGRVQPFDGEFESDSDVVFFE